tara:strand:- start:23 stop:847 length:825 start_codon:yes stop_codon:yes gene_type:complete
MLNPLKKIGKIFYDQAVKNKWSVKQKISNNSRYNEILKNGIVKLDENFIQFSNYINETYIKKLINETDQVNFKVIDKRGSDENNILNHIIGIDDENVRNFIENYELNEILSLLFNNKVYLRNDPLIQVLKTRKKISNGNFHTDRYMQFSLMLLLEDVNEDQTHMEYLEKSHIRKSFDFIIHKNFKECEKYQKKNNFKIFKVIGKKGDAFLFNTTGVHRANYILNTKRAIFHLNFTNGHNLYAFKINFDNSKIKNKIYLRNDPNLKFTSGKWRFF